MNKKNLIRQKSGFTLAELLVVVAILGILIALAMTISAPKVKNTTRYLYANAYNSLSVAYYNGLLLGYNPFDDTLLDDGVTAEHSTARDTGAEILCRCLTSYINTNDSTRYTKTITYENGDTKEITQDYSASCSSTKITSELANDFSQHQFIANSGMRFYISNKLGDESLSFYIVYVDLNGSRIPNSFQYMDDLLPDIYAFAMLDTGKVVPLGIPEYDKNVLTARIAYFNNEGDLLYTKKSLAYYQAKGAAWGYYSQKDNNLDYNETEPFTMNDAIRDKINPESKIRQAKLLSEGGEGVESYADITQAFSSPVTISEEHNCLSDDIESCYVFLDGYKQF